MGKVCRFKAGGGEVRVFELASPPELRTGSIDLVLKRTGKRSRPRAAIPFPGFTRHRAAEAMRAS
jgi:hypothetical protein